MSACAQKLLGEWTYADIVSYSASVNCASGFLSTIPTVLTTISTFPNSAMVSAKSLETAASLVKSAAKKETFVEGYFWARVAPREVAEAKVLGEL